LVGGWSLGSDLFMWGAFPSYSRAILSLVCDPCHHRARSPALGWQWEFCPWPNQNLAPSAFCGTRFCICSAHLSEFRPAQLTSSFNISWFTAIKVGYFLKFVTKKSTNPANGYNLGVERYRHGIVKGRPAFRLVRT
jgi:hypothetical protein